LQSQNQCFDVRETSSVSSAGVYLFDLTVDSNIELNDGTVYWIEGRPAEAAATLCARVRPAPRIPVSWTPAVSAPGLGRARIRRRSSAMYFSNMADQRVYSRISRTDRLNRLTPEGEYFYADGCYAAASAGGRIYYVREGHEVVRSGSRKEAENCLVLVSPSGAQPPQVVASGRDFYSFSARIGRLFQARLDPMGSSQHAVGRYSALLGPALDPATGLPLANAINTVQVPGSGPELNLQYPAWASANRLLYIGDQSGYWNLYSLSRIWLARPGCLASIPTVWSGLRAAATRVLLVSGDSVLRLDAESGSAEPLAQFKVSGYNSIKYPKWSGGYFYAVASSAVSPPAPLQRNPLRPAGYIFVAQPIEFPTANGATAHAYYYPPRNRDFVAPSGSRPPLLVRAHGGPTAAASPTGLAAGYALADVDYRGSTGYGTVYRNLLRYNWALPMLTTVALLCATLANK
uniref:Peptidase_S9 domain-containing protein n=1 Tax=Macrostomum lignano TaxID=282301 RepID=A0A1I8F2W8_9PLAT